MGPVDGSWELTKDVGGFRIVGGQTDGRVLVVQAPMLALRGKPVDDIAQDTTGDVLVWHGNTVTEYIISARARSVMLKRTCLRAASGSTTSGKSGKRSADDGTLLAML